MSAGGRARPLSASPVSSLEPHRSGMNYSASSKYRPFICGACSIADFRTVAEDLGYKVLVAEGSPIVLKIIVSGHVDAIKVPATLVATCTALAGFLLATVFYGWKILDPDEVREFLNLVAAELERAQNQSTAMEARARAAVARLQEISESGPAAPVAPGEPASLAAPSASSASVST